MPLKPHEISKRGPAGSSGAIAGEDVLHQSHQACQCRVLGQLVAKKTIDNMECLPSSGFSAQKKKTALVFHVYVSTLVCWRI